MSQCGGERPIAIDFWATWCGSCKAISPIFEKYSDSDEFSGIDFYKVNAGEQQEIVDEVGIRAVSSRSAPSAKYSFISQMPTFVLFKQGEKIQQLATTHPALLDVRDWSHRIVAQLMMLFVLLENAQNGSVRLARINRGGRVRLNLRKRTSEERRLDQVAIYQNILRVSAVKLKSCRIEIIFC